MNETFFIEQDVERLKRKIKDVDITGINLKLANKQKKHWIDITELGAKGDALFYDSVTNKYYSDAVFTTPPTPFSDIFNSASLLAQSLGMDLYIPSGTYLINKEMTLRSNVNIIGDFGKTILLISDTFTRTDDYVFRNESYPSLVKKDNLSFEGISIVYEGHVTPTFIEGGLEGIILKLGNISSFSFTKGGIKILNKGAKVRATNIWFRGGGSSNVDIYENYIENTTASGSCGCIWISAIDGAEIINNNINIHNNTIVKHNNDELFCVWGIGINKDINFYNNNIIYESNVDDIKCDKLICVFTDTTGIFENIIIKNNNIKLKGSVSIVFNNSIKSGTFKNVVYDNNNIIDYVGDSTRNILLSVCKVESVNIVAPETTYEEAYLRCGVSFSNNTYTNHTDYGRRCFASVDMSMLKLYNNIVRSKFDAVIYEENGNSKILSLKNKYNIDVADKYLSYFAKIKGQNTKVYFVNDDIKFKDFLYLRLGGSSITTNTYAEFKSCNIDGTYAMTSIQQAGDSGAITNFINNTFSASSLQLYYGNNAYVTTLGTLNLINNVFTNATPLTTSFTENGTSLVKANSIINISGNKWSDGNSDSAITLAPSSTSLCIYKLFPINKKILNLNTSNNIGWYKVSDTSWLPYYGLDAGVGTAIPLTIGATTVTMDSAIKTLIPTGYITLNATGGVAGQTCKVIITTSGTTAYVISWADNFKANGTLSTGTVDAKTFVVSFVCSGNGYTWIETGRTLAL